MGEILGFILVIYLAYLAIRYVIIPIFSAISGIAAIVGIVIGVIAALKAYIISIKDNINPYDCYVDNSKKKEEFADKRSYFFGPGYVQLKKTIVDAWDSIWMSVRNFKRIRRRMTDWTDLMIISQIVWVFAWVLYLVAVIAVGILGSMITCVLGAVHASILITFMAIIYVLFSVTWLIDRIYLQRKSIETSCPLDQTRVVIPMFDCPNCGNTHARLIPGPYGIWHRRCTCGEVLPTTFLLGRSDLVARCPVCKTKLASSDARQFALTIVGGGSSGKTVLISAFYHQMMEQIKNGGRIEYKIPDMLEEMFGDLERWYNGERCLSTVENSTSDMYSCILTSPEMETARQFTLYDIAGEAFRDPELRTMLPQKQMKDSDGVIFVIDPLASIDLRETMQNEGESSSNYSRIDPSVVISNFVTYLKTVLTNDKFKNRSTKPVSVVISKSDISTISDRISYQKIQEVIDSNPGQFSSIDEVRDAICREFLMDIGMKDAVNSIEAAFTNVHYFPVSAMGHEFDGTVYQPDHVTEPFYSIIKNTQSDLAGLLGIE